MRHRDATAREAGQRLSRPIPSAAIIFVVSLTRRRFIQAGLAGGAVLAAAGAYETWRASRASVGEGGALPPAGRALFGAVLPAFLAGVVPANAWTPDFTARAVDGVEATVGALPPNAQRELGQLIALLDHRAARGLLAGVWISWETVGPQEAQAILRRWRRSRFALLTGAYQALHDLSYASWYAEPSHWATTGYPGPLNIWGTPA